jgi:hypothetical protein
MGNLSEILQVTLGVSSFAAVIWLGFKLLQVMTRHNVLLAGQCIGEHSSTDGSEAKSFRYRLRLQNLESVHADYKLQVTIRGTPNGSHELTSDSRILSLVGWRSIDVVRELGSRPEDPYGWCAEFPSLPAFDTWSFDVILPCERLEFSLAFVGVETETAFGFSFGPYFACNRLVVFSGDRDEPRIRGPIMIPAKIVPFILSILAVASHVLVVTLSGWKIEWGSLGWKDLGLVALELLLIWLGYIAIRRPVYPVISGYRFVTAPLRKSKDGDSKRASDPSTKAPAEVAG